MPAFPEAAPAILTDIRLYSSDIMAFTDGGTKDLVIRTLMEPATNTCTVSVYVGDQPGGAVGREVARRVIFTGVPGTAPETPVTPPETAETGSGEAPGEPA